MKQLAVLALCITATAAHAEPRAWTAAKKTLPAGLQTVVGVNVAPLKTSALFTQLLDLAKSQGDDVGGKLERLKKTCDLDVTTAIDSAVVGLTSDQKAVIVIALKGTNQKALEACGQKIAKENGKTLTITKDGAITTYNGGDQDAYIKWLSKDTLALSPDKDSLTAMTAGGIAKDPIGAQAAKVNTSAALWGVVNKTTDIPEIHGKMTAGYATLDLKAGTLSVDLHLILDSAKAATEGVTMGQQQLDGIKKSGQVPKQFQPLLDSITLKATGSELICDGHVTEADLASLMGMLAAFAH
jgi:hypothetical protein